jgi:hypothetical protein
MSNFKTIPPDRKPESYDGGVRARKSAVVFAPIMSVRDQK